MLTLLLAFAVGACPPKLPPDRLTPAASKLHKASAALELAFASSEMLSDAESASVQAACSEAATVWTSVKTLPGPADALADAPSCVRFTRQLDLPEKYRTISAAFSADAKATARAAVLLIHAREEAEAQCAEAARSAAAEEAQRRAAELERQRREADRERERQQERDDRDRSAILHNRFLGDVFAGSVQFGGSSEQKLSRLHLRIAFVEASLAHYVHGTMPDNVDTNAFTVGLSFPTLGSWTNKPDVIAHNAITWAWLQPYVHYLKPMTDRLGAKPGVLIGTRAWIGWMGGQARLGVFAEWLQTGDETMNGFYAGISGTLGYLSEDAGI